MAVPGSIPKTRKKGVEYDSPEQKRACERYPKTREKSDKGKNDTKFSTHKGKDGKLILEMAGDRFPGINEVK